MRVRIPAWTQSDVPVLVNSKLVGIATADSYFALERTWKDSDRVTFELPMPPRLSKYHGLDAVAGFERYAIEYGPLRDAR